ncbi:hypothetical protein FRX31_019931 [Thalictrum thalictroides]|uniref:Uncharacterized protein n=1 Tax=Thalictrum thalictroides TaxID=46969 RepID=A0A7J6VZD6_THATH|nr:hypothetical protein FRX31_019931 [Thalictrum thalictroides]
MADKLLEGDFTKLRRIEDDVANERHVLDLVDAVEYMSALIFKSLKSRLNYLSQLKVKAVRRKRLKGSEALKTGRKHYFCSLIMCPKSEPMRFSRDEAMRMTNAKCKSKPSTYENIKLYVDEQDNRVADTLDAHNVAAASLVSKKLALTLTI